MSGFSPSPLGVSSISADDSKSLHKASGWFLALGITMVVLGSIAISWACLTSITVAATWLFGFVMLAGGIAEIVNAFSVSRWSGMLVHLLIGVLYVVVGFMIIDHPLDSAINLTRIIAVFLIVGGVFRMMSALAQRFPGWGWVLLNGGITLMMGLMIYKNWPSSGLWFIGLYLGIDMIFNGWAWIMLALGLRKISQGDLQTS